jgi:hypothetical protein
MKQQKQKCVDDLIELLKAGSFIETKIAQGKMGVLTRSTLIYTTTTKGK